MLLIERLLEVGKGHESKWQRTWCSSLPFSHPPTSSDAEETPQNGSPSVFHNIKPLLNPPTKHLFLQTPPNTNLEKTRGDSRSWETITEEDITIVEKDPFSSLAEEKITRSPLAEGAAHPHKPSHPKKFFAASQLPCASKGTRRS